MGNDPTKAGSYLGKPQDDAHTSGIEPTAQEAGAAETLPTVDVSSVSKVALRSTAPQRAPAEAADVFTLLPRDRYINLGRLGAGGMGEVHRVEDRLMGRELAMKVLSWELVDAPRERERFLHEARITSRLQHPGIIAVHDMGVLPDGRPWFTMKQVRGRTLRAVINDLHSPPAFPVDSALPSGSTLPSSSTLPVDSQARTEPSPDTTHGTPSSTLPQTDREPSGVAALASIPGERQGTRVTLRRVVEALQRICEAVAYAHSRGVIHRDIKPANLMVGGFGEVLVMDWGLALQLNEGSSSSGEIAGTLHYMAPEQLRNEALTPACDVYALGAVLHQVLTGEPPHAQARGPGAPRVMMRTPVPPIEPDDGTLRPATLCAICAQALQHDRARRYPDAGPLAEALRGFLDDIQRRERALARIGSADAQWPTIAALLDEAKHMRLEADRLLEGVRPFDPLDRKEPAWQLQDDAARLEREASLAEVTWQQTLRAALEESPELPEAHRRLADYYHRRLQQAQAIRDEHAATRAEALLRIHDRGHYRDFLRGEGQLTLHTDPPGARVRIFRYEEEKRVLVPKPLGELGTTPIVEETLPLGSYLLLIDAPGFCTTRYPVLIERNRDWDGIRPGEQAPHPIPLLGDSHLDDHDVYVPAGWFWCGGDPQAIEPLPRQRIWVDGFIMRRYPVTYDEYLSFLNALITRGDDKKANRHAPKAPIGGRVSKTDRRIVIFEEEIGYRLSREYAHYGRHPVARIDWHDAMAYAAWHAGVSGRGWRLPSEMEWEKAARGVDGRYLPWGDFFEITRACVSKSRPGAPGPAAVEDFPGDNSPHGIAGMAGNVRDWCANQWLQEGPAVVAGRHTHIDDQHAEVRFRASRGGAWTSAPNHCRIVGRFAGAPHERFSGQGFRLMRPL